jgi:co-chaperonin GroES (HSP10)
MKVVGKILPLGDKVFVTDMEFEMQKTASGIYIPSDDGKSTGIHPRWGCVWATGPDQTDVAVGDWILIEHGRWTRGIKVEESDGSEIEIRMVENNSIMMISDEKPADVQRMAAVGAGSNVNLTIPGL